MNWLISANSKIYDFSSSFEHFGFIDWKQGKSKYTIGDIVYIYCTRPIKKIRYKCLIEKIDLDFKNIRDDREYWINIEDYYKSLNGKFMHLKLIEQVDNENLYLNKLLEVGLKAAPQGPKKLDGILLNYIEQNFNDDNQENFYPEMINQNIEIYEGIKKQVIVNKYERSSIARIKCIEYNGLNCKICGLDFEEKYGKLGEGFIHIHHIRPISEIGKNYKIDYKKDLIPVCPNCHSMLHRKINGKEVTILELKKILNKNKT